MGLGGGAGGLLRKLHGMQYQLHAGVGGGLGDGCSSQRRCCVLMYIINSTSHLMGPLHKFEQEHTVGGFHLRLYVYVALQAITSST